MKKKDYKEEELDDEIIEDEVESEEVDDDIVDEDDAVIEDEEDDGFVDEDEEFVDDEVVKAPKKKKLSKKAKIAIISSSAGVAVVALVLIALFVILPAVGLNLFAKAKGGEIADSVDFSQKLTGYQTNPNNVTSKTQILNALEYDKDYMASLFNSSKDKNLIAAQMMFASYANIASAHQYSYFKTQIGTTNLGDKSGTLIVQRMRRQNQQFKDDTTLKLPYNHNFSGMEAAGVTGEGKTAIRYVKNGAIYRIVSKAIDYDEDTGFLYCEDWGRGNNWGDEETVSESANIKEARINYLSLVDGMSPNNSDDKMDITKPKAIFKKDTATIEDKGDYYEIHVEVDSDVADNDAETMAYFNEDNSASGAHIEKCEITFQIWKCGLPKAYVVDEIWSGKISAVVKTYQGKAEAKSEAKYSYTDEDCNDDSVTEAIWRDLL